MRLSAVWPAWACAGRPEAAATGRDVMVAADLMAPAAACIYVLACCGGVVPSECVGDGRGGDLEDELAQQPQVRVAVQDGGRARPGSRAAPGRRILAYVPSACQMA